MPAPALHLPVDFERRESVALLARAFYLVSSERSASDRSAKDRATLFALRIWLDWATAGTEWRALYRIHNPTRIDWSQEDLTFVIETAAGWDGHPGDLMKFAIDARLILIETRGDKVGLVLDGFWSLNEHLSPDFKSIQRRGGEARALKRIEEEGAHFAAERRETFDRQGILPFGDEKPTEQEQQLCYALFFRLHRVCGLEVPKGAAFSQAAMVDALNVVRRFTAVEIAAVENYLLERRDDPEVVKIPERILTDFGQYVQKA